DAEVELADGAVVQVETAREPEIADLGLLVLDANQRAIEHGLDADAPQGIETRVVGRSGDLGASRGVADGNALLGLPGKHAEATEEGEFLANPQRPDRRNFGALD